MLSLFCTSSFGAAVLAFGQEDYFNVSGITPSGDLTVYILGSRDITTPTSGNGTVQEIVATKGGGSNGFEMNLGNGFGAAGDKDKPRCADFGTGTADAMWINGTKQSGINPADTALTNGQIYSVVCTFSSIPTGDFFHFGHGGGTLASHVYFLSGKIYEIAVWNAVLSDAVIEANLNSRVRNIPLQLSPDSLIGYWRFDDWAEGVSLTGKTIKDYGRNGYNATGASTGAISSVAANLTYP